MYKDRDRKDGEKREEKIWKRGRIERRDEYNWKGGQME